MNPSEAAQLLFEQYVDEIYRYVAFILRDGSDAEDVVQDTFVQVLHGWSRFEHRSDPKTWLWAITNNMISKRLRRKRTEQVYRSVWIERSATPDPDFRLDFERALRNLPIPQQQVFLQRVVHGMSCQQTARSLGWSEAKVKVTLHRAVKSLRAWLSQEEEGQNEF